MPTNDELRAMADKLETVKAEISHMSWCAEVCATAAAVLRSILTDREEALDKIDGLQSDLDSAIAVMRRRVSGEASVESMGEWLHLNYPVKKAAS